VPNSNVTFISNDTCVNWNYYYTECKGQGNNPFQGTISFDNIGLAWVAIFLVSVLACLFYIRAGTDRVHAFTRVRAHNIVEYPFHSRQNAFTAPESPLAIARSIGGAAAQ
jgi:hypothetical protein